MTARISRKVLVQAGVPIGMVGGDDRCHCEGGALVLLPDERWGNPMFGDACLEECDFHIHARVTLDQLNGSGASVLLGGHYHYNWSRPEGNCTFRICLDEDRYPRPKSPEKVMRIVHGMTDPHHTWSPADDTFEKQIAGNCHDFFRPGEAFTIDIFRCGTELIFEIDGREVFRHNLSGGRRIAVGRCGDTGWPINVGFLPGRGTMRIHEFWAEGCFLDPVFPSTDIWQLNSGDYSLYRIPSICMTRGGRLLAFCEARRAYLSRGWEWSMTRGTEIQASEIHCAMKQSDDEGRTWSEQRILLDRGATYEARDPSPLVDRDTGEIFLFTRGPWVISSQDEGQTWSEPRSLSGALPGGWDSLTPGTANCAIQLQFGPFRGRLLLALYTKNIIGLLYSDDHGQTWNPGALTACFSASEPTLVERSDGRILVSPRVMNAGTPKRLFLISQDGGVSFVETCYEPGIPIPGQGQLLAMDWPDQTVAEKIRPLVFCGAADHKTRLTVYVSLDDGQTWPISRVIDDGSAANLALVALPGGEVGVLYERDKYRRLGFQRVNLLEFGKE